MEGQRGKEVGRERKREKKLEEETEERGRTRLTWKKKWERKKKTLFFYVASESENFVTSVQPHIQAKCIPILLSILVREYGHVRRQDDNRIPSEMNRLHGLVLT
jgi:hypothetical protein